MADSTTLFVLMESAVGYSLFEVVNYDEIIASNNDTSIIDDLSRFGRSVKLKSFRPFSTAQEALDNINAISEHIMTDTLHDFLEMNLPSSNSSKKKSAKTSTFSLGVIDPALATSITTSLTTITCRSDDTVREILRGCRLHFDRFIKGLGDGEQTSTSSTTAATTATTIQAQLGLGHAYSRAKVKYNPARSDNMIIQSIALLDQLDKDINTFAMRVKEWYSWHFPELKDVVKDNIMYARCAAIIQNKNNLLLDNSHHHHQTNKSTTTDDDDNDNAMKMDEDDDDNNKNENKLILSQLLEIVGNDNQEIVDQIVAAAKTSMGMDCSNIDMLNIVNFTRRIVHLANYRKQLSLYLSDKMNIVAPNLSTLIGDSVAARLISKAGSLTNLAKAPASTVQILGAEKALFRALKTKGNTPKYGLIYHSTFIGRADAKNKGRISRYLANKCSIATRIDSFSDAPSSIYGERLRDQVEERLRFYETGQAPKRNIDVMEQVSKELKAAAKTGDGDDVEMKDAGSEKKKKDKKRKSVEETTTMAAEDEEEEEQDHYHAKKKKKDKKRKAEADAEEDDEEVMDDDKAARKAAKRAKKEKKKKKKKKSM